MVKPKGFIQPRVLLVVMTATMVLFSFGGLVGANQFQECVPVPAEPLDDVCRDHWSYKAVVDLYRLGFASHHAGELVLNKTLSRFEMGLITLNIAKKVMEEVERAGTINILPPSAVTAVANLVEYYQPELLLLGSRNLDVFAPYANYEPPASEPVRTGGTDGSFIDLDGLFGDNDFDSLLGDVVSEGEFGIPENQSEEITDDNIGDHIDALLNELGLSDMLDESEPVEEDAGDTDAVEESNGDSRVRDDVVGTGHVMGNTSFVINGGTSIEFVRRAVVGTPYEEEDGEKVYIKPEELLTQRIWFGFTGMPNENVRLSARIEGRNEDGLMTDMNNLSIGAMSLTAETEHSEVWIGTLQKGVELDEDTKADSVGVRVSVRGDKISFTTSASRLSEVKEERTAPSKYYTSYDVNARLTAHSLVENWEFGLGMAARWDDPFTSTTAIQPPSRVIAGKLDAHGQYDRTTLAAMLEIQAYEEDTRVWGDTTTNFATAARINHAFENGLRVGGSVYYIGSSYQPERGKVGTVGEAGEWRPGEYGVDLSATQSFLNDALTVSTSLSNGVKAVAMTKEVNDKEVTEYVLHHQTNAGLTVAYGTPIVINEQNYGTFSISNSTNYTNRTQHDDDSLFHREISNVTELRTRVVPVENWENAASFRFNLGMGDMATDEKGYQLIDRKLVSFDLSSSYTWSPKENLSIRPRYEFNLQKDLGILPASMYSHNFGLNVRSDIDPGVFAVLLGANAGVRRVAETELDKEGEPVLGRSSFSTRFEAGFEYTPEWFEGFVANASVGKINVSYVDEDVIATGAAVKPTQDSIVLSAGVGYNGAIGQVVNWNINYDYSRTIDDVDEYDDSVHRVRVGGRVMVNEIVSLNANYDYSNGKKTEVHNGSLNLSIDLGPNTDFGVAWNRQMKFDKQDLTGDSDELVDEIRAYFSGSF